MKGWLIGAGVTGIVLLHIYVLRNEIVFAIYKNGWF